MSIRERAQVLRRQGMTYSEIAQQLGAPRSSVGAFASGIPLTPQQEQAIKDRAAAQATARAEKNRAARKEKTCPKCGHPKSVEDFHKRGDLPMGYCKVCQRGVVKERKQIVRAENRRLADDLKRRPCMDCGQSFEPCAMDFHHRDSQTKSFDVATAVWGGMVWARIEAEIQKCDVVCAVCHRYRTAGLHRRVV